jgi:protein-tyrosine phosphatase
VIDLHTHILHNIDDGARSLEDAVIVARAAVADGVTCMAATPHGRNIRGSGMYYSVELYRERLAELRAAIAATGLPLELVSGTEIYGEPGILPLLETGALLPYGTSRAVLVEFAADMPLPEIERLIFDLQVGGYRVVLAHPERLRIAFADLNQLIKLVERGVLLQLTADALLGRQGERLWKLAETMVLHRMVQLVASDCHGPHFDRMPNLGTARVRVADLTDPDYAEQLVLHVPQAILTDAPIDLPVPIAVDRPNFWQRLMGG